MIKTKLLRPNLSKANYKEIDQVINDFLNENQIDAPSLVDIKLTPVGEFQEYGEGEMYEAALVIYKVK